MGFGVSINCAECVGNLVACSIAYKLRRSNSITPYKVLGGNGILALVFLCGVAIIVIELIK